MRTIIAIMTIALIVRMCPVSFAQEKAEEGPVQSEDVEVLLNTLNEVLEENRKMRDAIQANDDAMQKMALESSALRTQVRRLKRAQDRDAKIDKVKLKKLELKLEESNKSLEALRQDNAALMEKHTALMENSQGLAEANEQLSALLDTAILESEREDYLNLIEHAQAVADRSVQELVRTKNENELITQEIAKGYYRLGNMLFDLNDYRAAIDGYENALKWDPQDAWCHHNLGVIYDYYLHEDAKALYHYNRYLKLKSTKEEANDIRERVLEIELKKNMVPGRPLREDYYDNYVKRPR